MSPPGRPKGEYRRAQPEGTPVTRWLIAAAALLACLPAGAGALHNIVDDAWATPQGHRFSGRVTENHAAAPDGSGKRRSLYNTTRLLFANGVEGRVRWSAGPLQWETRADDHGYWELVGNLPLGGAGLAPGWHPIESLPAASSKAGLLVHDPRNRSGLISDIDDTILVSEVNFKGRLLRNSFTRPAGSRQAVPGMAALYRQLVSNNPNPQATPLFYISATPRQLTDNVRRFLEHNGFPRGILQLKEVNTSGGDPWTDQKAYKLARIRAVLKAFPETRFMLLGDDGELDPEIFAELAAAHPGQIGEVWIRRVNPDPDRPRLPGQRDLDELLAQQR